MRRSIRTVSAIFWAVTLVAFLWYSISRILIFNQIFFEHSGIAVTQREAADLYQADHNHTRQQYIPRIIHQVFHNWDDPGNETLPSDWDKVCKTCTDANPDFEYMLWTPMTSRALLTTHYPWFLPIYDAYPHNVQRVDAIRYFALLHHGGIYLDLDNGCLTDLTPLLYYPTWTCDPGRGALSNNIIGAQAHHPFWEKLTAELARYDYDWGFPYVTVSWASGQWFVTAVWEEWHRLLPAGKGGLVRLMMDDREGADEWVFFTQERGGTWVEWDHMMFLWIGDHLRLVLVVVVGGVGGVLWMGVKRLRGWKGRNLGYKRFPSHRSEI